MTRTSLVRRDDFAANLADGWNDQGQPQDHDERSKVRAAAGSDTTISDIAKFTTALVRGDGLSNASRAETRRSCRSRDQSGIPQRRCCRWKVFVPRYCRMLPRLRADADPTSAPARSADVYEQAEPRRLTRPSIRRSTGQ